MSHSLWVEKYRPADLSTYIGNEHLKTKVQKYLDTENVSFKLDDMALLVNSGYPDIRRVINSAQRQVVNGTFFVGRKV